MRRLLLLDCDATKPLDGASTNVAWNDHTKRVATVAREHLTVHLVGEDDVSDWAPIIRNDLCTCKKNNFYLFIPPDITYTALWMGMDAPYLKV